MTTPRKEIVHEGEEAVYHCISRCVRRAFLCGYDSQTKKSFEHRKEWVRKRIRFLSSIFAIDILGYALMNNQVVLLVVEAA